MAYLGSFAKGLVDKTFDVAKDQLNRVDMQQAADGAKALAGQGLEAAKLGAANIDAVKIHLSSIDIKPAADAAKALAGKGMEVAKEQLSRVDTQQAADAAKALATKGFEAAKIGAANIDVGEIAVIAKYYAVATKDFAVAHPYLIGVNAVILLTPSWISVPILSAMGFSSTGVAAGACTLWNLML